MTTNTSYGTWARSGDRDNVSVEDTVLDAFGSYGPDGYDFDAIVAAYRDAINAALPPSVSLSGDEFYGPYYEADRDWDPADYPSGDGDDADADLYRDGNLNIRAIVKSVDLWAIIERHELKD